MCSNYNNNSICGGRNAIAYDNNRSGCGCEQDHSDCGCVGNAYENNCGCQNNTLDNGCLHQNNARNNGCGCGENVLGCAVCGAVNTAFRVIRGLERSVGGCSSCGGNNHRHGCGC